MALFDEIKARLEAQSLAGSGTNWELFANWMPDSPDQAVVITEVPGRTPQDFSETDFRQFEVRVRAAQDATVDAESKIDAIFRDLHRLGPTTLDGTSYGGITAVQPPHWFRVDQSQRDEFLVTFQALRART